VDNPASPKRPNARKSVVKTGKPFFLWKCAIHPAFEPVEGIDVTASRTCSRCGATLPSDVRWCGQCFQPVRELAPRAPIHRGDFVDTPHHTGPNVPHWSRWEASATTFGPVGRLGWTFGIVGVAVNAIFQNPLLLVFLVPAVLGVIHAIWRPGWVVPDDQPTYRRLRPEGPVKEWLFDVDELATTVIAAVIAIGVAALVIYGNEIVQFCVITAVTIAAAFFFFRKFFGRV
jgi:ribosomal protein L40E